MKVFETNTIGLTPRKLKSKSLSIE